MKKAVLIGFALVTIFALAGCGNSAKDSVSSASTKYKSSLEISEQGMPQYDARDIIKETLRIQQDTSLTKEEKMAAIEDIQRKNKKLLDYGLAN